MKILTGPTNPKTKDERYKKIDVRILVRVNLQATRLNDAFARPLRCTSSFHMNSTLTQHIIFLENPE